MGSSWTLICNIFNAAFIKCMTISALNSLSISDYILLRHLLRSVHNLVINPCLYHTGSDAIYVYFSCGVYQNNLKKYEGISGFSCPFFCFHVLRHPQLDILDCFCKSFFDF